MRAVYNKDTGMITRMFTDDVDESIIRIMDNEALYIGCSENAIKIENGIPIERDISLILQNKKEEQKELIKRYRNVKELSGFEYLGKIFDSDEVSLRRISLTVQAAGMAYAAGQDFSIDWTCQDNSVLTLTLEQILQLPIAIASYGNALHVKARQLKDMIEECKTIEEVEAITWNSA